MNFFKWLLAFSLLLSSWTNVFAYEWNFDFGAGTDRLMIGGGNQTYQKDSDGSTVNFYPEIDGIAKGTRTHAEIIVGIIGFEYAQGSYSYDVTVPKSAFSTASDIVTDGTVSTTNYGINLHLRRELGGAFFGVGTISTDEIIVISGEDYSNSTSKNYYKYGVELLFQPFILQVSALISKLGSRTVRTNAFELLFTF
ncbi:MAG: hypothetical protein ACI86H_001373 [bacterium]|jgi:hypothetical protein